MNRSNNKSEKTEGKSLPHKRAKVIKRRQYIQFLGESRKHSKATEMICNNIWNADDCGSILNGQHTSITDIFVDQQIVALFGDGATQMTN